MQNDNEKMWQQMANNNDRAEEIAKNTIEMVDKKLEENLEAMEAVSYPHLDVYKRQK